MPARQLAAVIYADIHGFQKLLRDDENSALLLAQSHRAILQAAAKRHHGRMLKNFGDACLFSFASAVDAVMCAITAQDLLTDYNAGKPPAAKLHARIGAHIGDILIENQNVFGNGVHVAKSLCAAAAPGGIALSQERIQGGVGVFLALAFPMLAGIAQRAAR